MNTCTKERIAALQDALKDVVPGLPGDGPKFDAMRQELADLWAGRIQATALKDTKPGELVKFKPTDTAPVWKRGEYVRASRGYSLTAWDDINREVTRKGSTLVYIGFTF